MRKEMMRRLGLGTVQFGLDYGISNLNGQLSESEIFDILDRVYDEGINTLDTSGAYGNSEQRIGEYFSSREKTFEIVTKLSLPETADPGEILEIFQRSLRQLNVDSVYGYLIHNFKDFVRAPEIWEEIQSLKQKGLMKKAGFSLYKPEELALLWEKGIDFDLVQIPYSIFDQRFAPYLKAIKDRGVEIHARSIFLQGLMFLDPRGLNDFFTEAKPFLQRLRDLGQSEKIPLNAICLNAILSEPMIDKVIVGVESLESLQDNIAAIQYFDQVISLKEEWQALALQKEDILLPYGWPKKE